MYKTVMHVMCVACHVWRIIIKCLDLVLKVFFYGERGEGKREMAREGKSERERELASGREREGERGEGEKRRMRGRELASPVCGERERERERGSGSHRAVSCCSGMAAEAQFAHRITVDEHSEASSNAPRLPRVVNPQH